MLNQAKETAQSAHESAKEKIESTKESVVSKGSDLLNQAKDSASSDLNPDLQSFASQVATEVSEKAQQNDSEGE